MYGLPPETDVSFLIGRVLIQLCIGRHQVIFNFDGEVSISVEAGFEARLRDGSIAWAPRKPERAAAALQLIGSKTTGSSIKPGGALTLEFGDGASLTIRDAGGDYESYQMTGPSGTIVV